VQITGDPLLGAAGLLIHSKPAKDLLVLSADFLRRSMAVERASSAAVAALARGLSRNRSIHQLTECNSLVHEIHACNGPSSSSGYDYIVIAEETVP
jgi:hypothetical protein